ncbi:MAG: NAD-dependent DNA ligase LigA, partial [Salinibacterium sp.]|nr:NAD-dependent DNA ligase LigA [Salinibacterium sp.]
MAEKSAPANYTAHDLETAKVEAERLTVRTLELRESYYERDSLLVSDDEYDSFMRRLEELERLFPELQSQDSPTQSVGGRASSLFDPVVHAERMLSLDNVFSLEQFAEWAARVERGAGRKVNYLCELKIDGLAINLRYENGTLTSAATRGDGVTGEDVTENISFLAGIPARLAGSGHPPLVEVRGEVYFPVASFREL